MCCVRFVLFVLGACVGGGYCSFMFNDTSLAALPPLNAVDEWAQCRREDDVYCLVDAALVSEGPSELLTLLQEFSSQTLRHYNRTQIHRALCMSRCGVREEGAQPWHAAAKTCMDQELAKYGLQASVLSVRQCVGASRPEPSASARALAVFVVVICALVALATGLHVLGDRCSNVEGNKYLLAFSLKRNWQILTYNRNNPRTDQRMKNLTSIEGIRVIGVHGVIISHVLLMSVYSLTSNPDYMEKWLDTFSGKVTVNNILWLQVFCVMSGFVTAYTILITADRGPLTLWKCFMSVVNRYIRLTPAAGVALWYVMSWHPLLAWGPQLGLNPIREAEDCSRRWWHHLLYLQNHLVTGQMCMGQTWYLAVDMQLHVVGLLVMYLLLKCPRAAGPILVAMWAGSGMASGLVAYFYQVRPVIAGQTPEYIRTQFLGTRELTYLYMPFWMNLTGYAAGVMIAYVFNYTQVQGIKLSQKKWFNLLFHLSLLLGSCVAALGVVFLTDTRRPRWAEALYSSLDRPLVAACFALFLLGCVTKCKSGLRTFLEWRGFHFLGRLSFSVFLLHFAVLGLFTSGNTQLIHISFNFGITYVISTSVLSHILAIPFCLLFELPPIQLWKAFIGSGGEGERPQTQAVTSPPPDAIKPLDLVANIRRNQDVC